MTTPFSSSGFQPPWPVDQTRVDRNWRAITIELDAPRPGRLERLLRLLGMPVTVTRLLAATPALRRSWFLATALAMLIGIGATDASKPRDDLFVLLFIGPLVPVLGVAMAYGAEADPAHEISLATPMRGLRLIAIRATAVLGFSSFWLLLTGVAAPGRSPMAFAGLIPSLGLTAATVAMMTVTRPRAAAGFVAAVWTLAIVVVQAEATDPLAAFTAPGQLLLLMVGVVATAIAVARRERFDRLAGGEL
ncbi:MAG: zf-HC2 domain-containing protein [Actinomycetota bacterium]